MWSDDRGLQRDDFETDWTELEPKWPRVRSVSQRLPTHSCPYEFLGIDQVHFNRAAVPHPALLGFY